MVTHIRSEQDAWEFLFRCWIEPEFGNDGPVAFDRCVLSIRLDPGNGKSDWKINRAIGLLQQHVNMAYLLARRGEPYGHLSTFDREQLSLTVEIATGSTILNIDLAKPMEAIQKILPTHWSPRMRSIVTVGALLAVLAPPYVAEFRAYRAAIDTATIAAKATLETADRTNRTNAEIARIHAHANVAVAKVHGGMPDASHEPDSLAMTRPMITDRAAVVLAELAQTDPSRLVPFATSDAVSWRPALLDLAPYAGSIQWNGGAPMPAPVAKAVAKATRTEATKQRRIAKENGHRGIIPTPWVTEVVHTHSAPGAMRLGLSDA